MSTPIIIEVLRHGNPLSHAAKLVLLAITAYIEEHGAPAYPSQATLAKDSGVTERYIEACVQECEAAGFLLVDRQRLPGKRPRNYYTLLFPWRTIPEASSGKPVRGSQFPETPSLENLKKEKDLQEKAVPRSTITETSSPNGIQGSVVFTPEEEVTTARKLGLAPDSTIYPLCFPAPQPESSLPRLDGRPHPKATPGSPCIRGIAAHIESNGRSWRWKSPGGKGICYGCYVDAHGPPPGAYTDESAKTDERRS